MNDKVQFVGNDDPGKAYSRMIGVYDGGSLIFQDCVPFFDLRATTMCAIEAGGNRGKKITMHCFHVKGGSGTASTSTGAWKGAFMGHRTYFEFIDMGRGTGGGVIHNFDGLTYAQSKSIRWEGVNNFSYIWDAVEGGGISLIGYVASDWDIAQGDLASPPAMNLYLINGDAFNV